MRHLAVAISIVTFFAMWMSAEASDAIGRARAQIAAKDCRAAVTTLQSAMPDAAAISDSKQRDSAIAAVHFYTALAYSECADAENAKKELREFFGLQSGHSSLDPAKFPAPFIRLFNEVQRTFVTTAVFNGFYPGFNEKADVPEEKLPLHLWSTSAAFQLLADENERSDWGSTRTDEERAAFIDRFWARRDPNLSTPANEFRTAVARRVEFADRHFGASDELRGAMSDRGRVFVLLGPPARAYQQALGRYETTVVGQRTRTPITGNLERWVYFRPQLPPGVSVQQVEFRFITHPGYGDHVMQRDFWPLKALAEAPKPRPAAE